MCANCTNTQCPSFCSLWAAQIPYFSDLAGILKFDKLQHVFSTTHFHVRVWLLSSVLLLCAPVGRHGLTVVCGSLYYANLKEQYRIMFPVYNLLMRPHADRVYSQHVKFWTVCNLNYSFIGTEMMSFIYLWYCFNTDKVLFPFCGKCTCSIRSHTSELLKEFIF